MAQGFWRGARWGMSPEDIAAAFPGEAEVSDHTERPRSGMARLAIIHRCDVAGVSLTVQFMFDDRKLRLVFMGTELDSRSACVRHFNELDAWIVAQQGQPSAVTSGDHGTSHSWTTPIADIGLNSFSMRGPTTDVTHSLTLVFRTPTLQPGAVAIALARCS